MPTDLTRLQSNQPVLITDGTNSVAVTAGSLLKIDGGSSSNIPVALQAGSNLVGAVKVTDAGGSNQLAVDASGRVSVLGITNALPTGANTIGTVNLGTGQPDVTQAVSIAANSTGSTALAIAGMQGVGFFLNAVGTGGVVKPQISMDGGTTWTDTVFIAPSTGVTSTTAGSATTNQIIANTCGASHVRVFTTALASGTLTGTLRATESQNGGALNSTAISSALPAGSNLIGGIEIYDGAGTNKLAVDSGGNASVNLGKVGGTAFALGQTTMSASLPVTIASNQSAVSVSDTALELAQASTTSGQKGVLIQGAVTTAAPSYTTAQTSPLSLTTTGLLRVDGSGVTQPVSGTITANIGTAGTLALDASVTGLQVAQASTTSGQKGGLTLGAVTTNAPTYTTAQSNPLSLDTAGLLRVSLKDTPQNTTALKVDGSAVTQPVSGTVSITANSSVNVNQLAGTATSVNSGTKDAGTLRIVIATDQPQLTNALKVDGSAVTQPVSFGETTTGQVNNYVATASTASGATANADYTVTSGKTLYLKSVMGSASAGPCKFDITADPSGTPVSLGTFFITSTNPTFQVIFSQPPAIAATKVLRVVCTNSNGNSQSMYVLASGHEI